MDHPSTYWPASASASSSRSSSQTTLVDAASARVAPSELPAIVAAKISPAVIDYLVDRVCDAVDYGLGRPSSSSSSSSPVAAKQRSRNLSRSWQSDKGTLERAAVTEFVATVLRRAEVTLSVVLGALIYIDRARPHLSIAIEGPPPLLPSLPVNPKLTDGSIFVYFAEWAHHRVLLGALITASKYLNDASLKNAHWALCTGVFGRRDVQRIEREFLDVLDWQLGVSEADLVNVCSAMVSEGALVRPVSEFAKKELRMEVDGRRELESWDEKVRRGVRPEKRAQTDVDMDVDDFAEERARMRRSSTYSSPASSDTTCSTCSPDTDSDAPQTPSPPPPPPKLPHAPYAVKPLAHHMHTKSNSSGSMGFHLLDSFPSVPAPSSVRSRSASTASVSVPNAPPPLPSLPPYPLMPISRAFLSQQRPHSARPASPYAKLSLAAAPGTASRSRPTTPYAHTHKRSSALSLYPAYIPANV